MDVARTYHELPFNTLDPARFETLILAIVYRMTRWEDIRHFGESGGDDGIDISAIETLENEKIRTWHFQCKRYKKINVAQMRKIIDSYTEKNATLPDKYVLVIGCGVSKKADDDFKKYAMSKGLQSVIIWTKSEIEAMLYADYHDLLFAYFGISLSSQRNNSVTSLRRNIALKKRMRKDFIDTDKIREAREKNNSSLKFVSRKIIMHSIDDRSYPNGAEDDSEVRQRWCGVAPYDFYHNGLVVYDQGGAQKILVHGRDEEGSIVRTEEVTAAVLGYIPYSNIIDYDIDGDEYYQCPHIYCDYTNTVDPYEYVRFAKNTDVFGMCPIQPEDVAEVKLPKWWDDYEGGEHKRALFRAMKNESGGSFV